MISLKVHESYRKVIAVCDTDIIGKKFFEGNRQLDLRESFYSGENLEKEKAVHSLKRFKLDDATFNIVGKKAIQVAIDAGLIDENGFDYVDGIPFSLILL